MDTVILPRYVICLSPWLLQCLLKGPVPKYPWREDGDCTWPQQYSRPVFCLCELPHCRTFCRIPETTLFPESYRGQVDYIRLSHYQRAMLCLHRDRHILTEMIHPPWPQQFCLYYHLQNVLSISMSSLIPSSLTRDTF